MGLGKTVQVAAYLKGLFDAEMIKRVIIIVPATMKSYWISELNKWFYDDDEEETINIVQLDDKKKSERFEQIRNLRKRGGILLTSYTMVSTERLNLTEIKYDVMVIDEGHKAKNKNTQFRKDTQSIRVKGHRLILSGTPLQNNLAELWSVFDLVQPRIFGSFDRFERDFAQPIERGLLKDSTPKEKRVAQALSNDLR